MRSYKFYNEIGPARLQAVAAQTGLDRHVDLAQLRDLFARGGERVLEVGGGHGRVVEGLLGRAKPASISVVEQADSMARHLRKRFKTKKKVTIHKTSLLHYESADLYDRVLWMWSGFADLNPRRQRTALRKVSSLLRPDGTFVIDLPKSLRKTNGVLLSKRRIRVRLASGTVYIAHIPTHAQMLTMARAAGLRLAQKRTYELEGGRGRVLYVFRKRETGSGGVV